MCWLPKNHSNRTLFVSSLTYDQKITHSKYYAKKINSRFTLEHTGKDSVVRSIELLSNGTIDRAGNEAEHSVRLDWTVDHTPPNLISASLAHNNVPLEAVLTNDRSFNITFRFNEPVCCIEDTMHRFALQPSDRFIFENVHVMDSNRTYA